MKSAFAKCLALILAVTMLAGMTVNAEESKEETKQESNQEAGTVNNQDDRLHDLPTEWDVTLFYPDEEAFNKDMDRVIELLPSYEKHRGKLNSKEGILQYIQDENIMEITAIIQNANMYQSALSSTDASDPLAMRVKARVDDVGMQCEKARAFVDPEIRELPIETRREIYSDPELAPYAYNARELLDPDAIVLDEKTQVAFDLMAEAAAYYQSVYDVFDNVDLPAVMITMPDGSEEKLTEELYSKIMSDRQYDHDFKIEVCEKRLGMRNRFANTYAALLDGAMAANWNSAQVFGFDTTLAAALHDSDVDPAIYTKIIESTHKMLPVYQDYLKTKKEKMKMDEMYLFDLNVPTSSYTEKEISYEDAVNTGRDAIRVWGDEYLSVFDKIVTNPLIDVYPKDKKAGGAHEFLMGKKTLPLIMYNFDGRESYISTIVHELGHAVYSEFSAENQNYYNDNPGVFTQEVASTANECMFHSFMVRNAKDEDEKLFWLEQEIGLFSGTILTQCMFSEFEDYCYKEIEAGRPLSPAEMEKKYEALSREYNGDAIIYPEHIGSDWTRIGHFYYDYYVYKYATSMTYAAAICRKVESGEPDAVDKYIRFLKLGCSASPAELLKVAGVDPLDDATYEEAYEYFKGLVEEYKELCAKQ